MPVMPEICEVSFSERIHSDHDLVKHLSDTVDHWNLRWAARGKIKDSRSSSTGSTGSTGFTGSMGAKTAGRRIHLSGSATNSGIRVHRGGIAILSAMFSRAYVQDVRHAPKTGGVPTIDDPTRGQQS